MKRVRAVADYYFETGDFPLSIRRVHTDSARSPSHPHDLTEVEHSHAFCELVIVTRGTARHCLEGRDFPVAAGDVFLLQGRQRHYFHDRQNLDLTNVMYDPERIGLPENELRRIPGYCAVFLLEPALRRSHRFESRLHLDRIPLARVEQIVSELEREYTAREPGCEAVMRAKLIELIAFLSRAYTTSGTTEAHALLRVGSVIGALENDIIRNWTLDELLEIAHMSRSTLMRKFRQATGQTPVDYLIGLRIRKAIPLLQHTGLPITEIAFDCGFTDSNYFTRQFRRITGISPSACRKNAGTH